MISRLEAVDIARRYLNAQCASVAGGVAIIDDLTIEKSYGWIFFYDASRFLETGNPLEALGGNGPLLVERIDGRVHHLSSAHPAAVTIAEFERSRGWSA